MRVKAEAGDEEAQAELLEIRIHQALDDLSDTAQFESMLKQSGVARQKALIAHLRRRGSANTGVAEEGKARDWKMYLILVFGGEAPLPNCCGDCWPPSAGVWLQFLVDSRAKVSSYSRWLCLLGNVCNMGEQWYREDHPGDVGVCCDPRVLYRLLHHKCCKGMAREYGMSVRQVRGIDLSEARNAWRYADTTTVKGAALAAAFYTGAILGGRRARSLTAIHIKDVEFTIHRARLPNGEEVSVPSVNVSFKDEKFDDIQGPRFSCDYCGYDNYAPHNSAAHWLYRLLVLRGAFSEPDRVRTQPEHTVLQYREGAGEWFLFCDVPCSCMWTDAMPVSTATLSLWTKILLERMDRPGRGFSAHRRGFVTRACILEIISRKGKGLSDKFMNAITRAGGWQSITGVQTVMRVYANKIIDTYLSTSGLTMGRSISDWEWERRLAMYRGPDAHPQWPPQETGATNEPLPLRWVVMHDAACVSHRQELSRLAARLLQVGNADLAIMPMNRYRQQREVVTRVAKSRPNALVVVEYKAMRGRSRKVYNLALDSAMSRLVAHFRAMCMQRGCVSLLGRFARSNALARLKGVTIGNVPLLEGDAMAVVGQLSFVFAESDVA